MCVSNCVDTAEVSGDPCSIDGVGEAWRRGRVPEASGQGRAMLSLRGPGHLVSEPLSADPRIDEQVGERSFVFRSQIEKV